MWQDQASCAGVASGRDHPFITTSIEAAKALAEEHCAGCPVRRACGEAADRRREWGLWGGSLRTKHPSYVRFPLLDGIELAPLHGRNGQPLPAKGRADIVTAWDDLIELGHTPNEAAQLLNVTADAVRLARSRPAAKRPGRPRKPEAA